MDKYNKIRLNRKRVLKKIGECQSFVSFILFRIFPYVLGRIYEPFIIGLSCQRINLVIDIATTECIMQAEDDYPVREHNSELVKAKFELVVIPEIAVEEWIIKHAFLNIRFFKSDILFRLQLNKHVIKFHLVAFMAFNVFSFVNFKNVFHIMSLPYVSVRISVATIYLALPSRYHSMISNASC